MDEFLPHQSPWQQVNVQFTAAAAGEDIATEHLLPALSRAQASGDLTWWFLRKPPGWRLRLRQARASTVDPLSHLTAVLQAAQAAGFVARWWPSVYEEETTAFGGQTGMGLAHDLFIADSAGIAHLLTTHPYGDQEEPDRRLLSLLLMSHLLQAAGLDLNERGDVWAKVAAQRPEPDLSAETAGALAAKARSVLTTDTAALTYDGRVLQPVARWAAELAGVGARLGEAGLDGSLHRGLRAVLALHVIFHWNRMGVAIDQQAVWATSCKNAFLGDI